MYKYYVYPDELYHHGVKGMKWGVRRFQNEDGTLNAEGQKRYEVVTEKRGFSVRDVNSGKKMKGRTRRTFEKSMRKEDAKMYKEYKHYKNLANSGATYVGSSSMMALAVTAVNAATTSSRESADRYAKDILTKYANTYLDDIKK